MSGPDLKAANVARAQFNDLGPNGGGATGQEMNLNLILDVAVTLALEVGRARMSVRDLLQLAPGAIVELDRLAGEPLDVLVNGVRIARGEVVVVDDKFGIRLTDVVSATERMEHAQ
jgi:flagellar motor switch protein FliN/FliY